MLTDALQRWREAEQKLAVACATARVAFHRPVTNDLTPSVLIALAIAPETAEVRQARRDADAAFRAAVLAATNYGLRDGG